MTNCDAIGHTTSVVFPDLETKVVIVSLPSKIMAPVSTLEPVADAEPWFRRNSILMPSVRVNFSLFKDWGRTVASDSLPPPPQLVREVVAIAAAVTAVSLNIDFRDDRIFI